MSCIMYQYFLSSQWLKICSVIIPTLAIRELGHRHYKQRTQRHMLESGSAQLWTRAVRSRRPAPHRGSLLALVVQASLDSFQGRGSQTWASIYATWTRLTDREGWNPAQELLIHQVWGWAQESAFLTTFHGMLMWLVWEPHFKSHWLIRIQNLSQSHRKVVWVQDAPLGSCATPSKSLKTFELRFPYLLCGGLSHYCLIDYINSH